jgi:multiple sugar transport system permease protein
MTQNQRVTLSHGLAYVFLTLVGVTMVFPLLWMLVTSLRSAGDDVMDLGALFTIGVEWQNYREVLSDTTFARAIYNSALVTVVVTIAQLFTSSLAAYAFARMQFRGRNPIFLGYLSTMMVPEVVTMIPVFILLRFLGWIDSYAALILPAAFSAYGTFMLRQFFLSIPRELEEAAVIDGCNSWGIYWNVILPLAKPALAALGILTFMGSWRSFMWPLIVTQSEKMLTAPVALSQFQELHGVQWTLLMAGSVIMLAPMLLVFILGQKFFVAGIQVGAVKG